jgi:hypothetical protein
MAVKVQMKAAVKVLVMVKGRTLANMRKRQQLRVVRRLVQPLLSKEPPKARKERSHRGNRQRGRGKSEAWECR